MVPAMSNTLTRPVAPYYEPKYATQNTTTRYAQHFTGAITASTLDPPPQTYGSGYGHYEGSRNGELDTSGWGQNMGHTEG
jgi:hypothetical protein